MANIARERLRGRPVDEDPFAMPMVVAPEPEAERSREQEPSNMPRDHSTLLAFRTSTAKSALASLKAFGYLLVYLGLSVSVMCALEPGWTAIDAAYFGMATMSTVGYGDLSPSSTGSRIFALFLIIFGVIFVFSSVAGLVTSLTAPLTARGREALERAFPMDGVDLEGDGQPDFFKPRHPLVYYFKNLLPSLVLTVALQLASAAIFVAIDASMDFGSALYHCIVTATTVGFGDVPNATQGGRLWACVHMLLSVALLGELITTFDELRAARAKMQERTRMLTTRLNGRMLDNLLTHAVRMRPLVVRDGLGLTELEFVLAMMLELQVVDLEQVRPFVKQFRLLDVDGNARLGRDDLDASCDKSLAELQTTALHKMQRAISMGVGDRMALAVAGTGRASPSQAPSATSSPGEPGAPSAARARVQPEP